MKKLWLQYTQITWEKKILWTAAGLAVIPILAGLLWRSDVAPPENKTTAAAQMDTYIPKGFVLVPIDVQNFEALDSILGHFGVVDLLQTASPTNPQQHLVARNVRILRAPQNPSHFAILVEEGAVATVLKYGSQFTVIVKRPDKTGTEFVKEDKVNRRAIIYEGE